MPPQVSVLIGPTRAGKTFQLLGQFGQTLRDAPSAVDLRALWLAPTSRTARTVAQTLLASSSVALLQPGILTFEQLVDRILASAPLRRKLLTPSQQRELLRQIVRDALETGNLTALADVARRSGFVDLLVDHVRELKRRGMGPAAFEKSRAARKEPAKHADLALLYSRYENLLADHGLYDLEGRYSPACQALAGDCPWLNQLRLIVVDGFTDFTQVQLDLIVALANHVDRLLVSLPGEGDTMPAAGRDDLFAKPEATLAELLARFPQSEIQRLPARPSDWPALDHLAAHLFRNPRHIPALPAQAHGSLDRLSIVPASGAHDEIVELAREIKRRLVAGEAKPGDVAVVFRSLGDAAPRVREVFSDFGIPHLIESGTPLLASGAIRTLLGLLRLATEDWPFRRVVAVVTNNSLTALDGPSRAAADWLVRELQIAKGRKILLARVAQLSEQQSELPLGHPALRRADAAVAALPLLDKLATTLDELPASATPSEWSKSLARLGSALGMRPFVESSPDQLLVGFIDDQAAWRRIVELLAGLDHLAAWQGRPPAQLSIHEFVSLLLDLAKQESLPQAFDEVGRVRVLSAATARTVAVKQLFLAGLSEQAFPSPERTGRFYSERDYRQMSSAASGARGRDLIDVSRSQEEMLLFYEVLTRASQCLTLSYPAVDDKAQALPPSPYVTELERTLGREEFASRRTEPQLSPIPAGPAPFSPAEWRIQAVAEALQGKSGLLARLLADKPSAVVAQSLEAALKIVHARARGNSFGPFEGILTSPAARQRLAQQFGPQHLWSPSQLETYAGCPYLFFLKEVLGLAPLGELTLATDFARRGTFLHDVLAEFHRELLGAGEAKRSSVARDQSAFVAAFEAAVDSVRQTMPRAGVDAALVEIDRRQILEWAEEYFHDSAKYDQQWSGLAAALAPAHFEVRFGPRRPGETGPDDSRSTDRPLEVDIGGEHIQITGRIDRIDVGQSGDRLLFNVIDYKSGRRPTLSSERIESGECLQPALYVMAAQAAVFVDQQAVPVWSGYWSMRNGLSMQPRSSLHCSTGGDGPTDQWQNLQPLVAERIGQIVRSIRRGEFPVASRDDQCTSRCDYNTVCRIAQVRSLAKTWPPEISNNS